jgi:phage terminase small subunit
MTARKPKTPPKRKPGSTQSAKDARITAFVEAYFANGGNTGEAARTAGYSPKSADNAAWRLMKDAKVLQRIADRQASMRQKLELNTEGVLRNLAQAVYFDPRKLFNPDGTLKRVIDLDDDTAMALQSFEVTESIGGKGEDATPMTTNKVKWLDKNSARDQANRILGQYKDKIEVGADDDFVKAMLNGRARAAAKR